jgi:hypothetical protein
VGHRQPFGRQHHAIFVEHHGLGRGEKGVAVEVEVAVRSPWWSAFVSVFIKGSDP